MASTNPVGPTGKRVAQNVIQLREAQKMTYKDLSRHLSALGQPIAVLGLKRIETCTRRVDVDDLVALATALNVTPTQLLSELTIRTELIVTTGDAE